MAADPSKQLWTVHVTRVHGGSVFVRVDNGDWLTLGQARKLVDHLDAILRGLETLAPDDQ